MTRFAGSAVDFTPQSLSAAASGGGYGAAGGVVDINDSYAKQRETGPQFDALAQQGIVNRSQEKQASMQASADVTAAGLSASGQTKGAALQAEGQIAAAKAEAEATKSAGMMGAIGQIASAGLGLFGSDENIKTAITPIDSALTKLRELKPVTFYYKPEYGDHTRVHHGFVAQEFRKVLPDATYENEDGILSIDPIDVIGLLVRANQELESRVARMEAKLVSQAV